MVPSFYREEHTPDKADVPYSPSRRGKPRKAMLQHYWEGAKPGTRCAPQTLLLVGVPHSAALCCKNPGDSRSLLAAIINLQVQQQCSWTSKTTPPLTVPQILVTPHVLIPALDGRHSKYLYSYFSYFAFLTFFMFLNHSTIILIA